MLGCSTTSGKSFSYDNGRVGVGLVLTKLDKVYVPSGFHDLGGRIGVVASHNKISDHSPVSILDEFDLQLVWNQGLQGLT
jgi:hypothetical protein